MAANASAGASTAVSRTGSTRGRSRSLSAQPAKNANNRISVARTGTAPSRAPSGANATTSRIANAGRHSAAPRTPAVRAVNHHGTTGDVTVGASSARSAAATAARRIAGTTASMVSACPRRIVKRGHRADVVPHSHAYHRLVVPVVACTDRIVARQEGRDLRQRQRETFVFALVDEHHGDAFVLQPPQHQ